MNSRFSIAVLAVASLAFTRVATGTNLILNFDDLPDPGANADSPIPSGYAGLQWNNFWYLNYTNYPFTPNGYENAAVSTPNVAFNAFGAPAQISGATFNLNSAYFTAAWNDGLQLEVQGFVGTTLTYDNTYTLNTSGPLLINFNYLGVDEVNFISSGGTQNPAFPAPGEHFAIDNIGLTIVPEPSALALLGMSFSFLTLLALNRRKKLAWENPYHNESRTR